MVTGVRILTVGVLACVACAGTGFAKPNPDVASIYERLSPAVVSISAVERDVDGELLEYGGSGVLIEGNRVLTASHVVEVATSVTVHFSNGEELKASVVASRPGADIALLELSGTPKVTPALLGDSSKTAIGERVVVVGAPLGFEQTLSVGYLSGRRNADIFVDGFALGELLQTDAAINSGNSGGPMLNQAGEVIGIVSHSILGDDGGPGINFAISSNTVRRGLLSPNAIWVGLDGMLLTPRLARLLNVPHGILVKRVAPGSAAERLGFRGGILETELDGWNIVLGGDVVRAVQGIELKDRSALLKVNQAIRSALSEPIRLTVLRDGSTIQITTTLDELKGKRRTD